jgi:hypothetical protein
MFKVPKYIANHPAVLECVKAEDCYEGIKYDIYLKEGWHLYGEDGICEVEDYECTSLRRMGFYSSVKDFKINGAPRKVLSHPIWKQ